MSKQLNLFSYFGGQKVVNSVNTTVNEIQDEEVKKDMAMTKEKKNLWLDDVEFMFWDTLTGKVSSSLRYCLHDVRS